MRLYTAKPACMKAEYFLTSVYCAQTAPVALLLSQIYITRGPSPHICCLAKLLKRGQTVLEITQLRPRGSDPIRL